MSLIFWVHSLLIGTSIFGTYLWTQNPVLSHYNLQLFGLLTLVYFLSKRFSTTNQSSKPGIAPSTAILLTVASLLLVFSTGNINSPLFFILDFLLFALALLFEPTQAITTSLYLSAIFLLQDPDINPTTLINLASLLAMTPLAMFFAKMYLSYLQAIGKIENLEEQIKDIDTESLLWIATTAKPSIASVLNSVSEIVTYFNAITYRYPSALSSKLHQIQQDLITLYSSTEDLKTDLETDIKSVSDNNENNLENE